MLRSLLFIGIFFLVLPGTCLRAQIFPERIWWQPGSVASLPVIDSMQMANPITIFGVDFQHTLSLFSWASSLHLASNTFITTSPLTPAFSVSSEGRSRLRADTRIRTSEANGLINADYPFDAQRDGLTVSFFGTTYNINGGTGQSLAQSGTLTSVTDGYGVLGGKYFITPSLEITAGGGLGRKSFEFGAGSGTIVKAGIIESPTLLSDRDTLDATAALDERHFFLRHQTGVDSTDDVGRNDYVHARLATALRDGYNEASGGFYLKRQDFFFPKDTTLAKQERNELGFDLHDALQLQVIPNYLIGNFRVDLEPRQITRRTPSVDISSLSPTTLITSTFLVPSTSNILDASADGKLDLFLHDHSNRIIDLSAEMKYDEKSETDDIIRGETGSLPTLEVQNLSNALGAASFDGKQTSVLLGAIIPIADLDLVHADFSARIFRYDTPSPDNHDDRDELNLGSTIGYTHYFSDFFQWNAALRLTRNHLVYLKSDRSLQNYVSRTISFTSQTVYRTSTIQHQLSGEVFANYSVYDFPAPITQVGDIRDYLIRGVNGSDSIQISVGKFKIFREAAAAIGGIFDLRLYERGAYEQAAFTERPVLRTSEFSGEVTLNLSDVNTSLPTLIKIGARAFLLRRSSPNIGQTDLDLQEKIDRIGPLLVVIIDELALRGPRLYGSIWYSFVNQQDYNPASAVLSRQIEARLAAQWTF